MPSRVRTGVLASLLLASPVSAMPPNEARAWRDDLRFMAVEMERTHKNLYHDVSREEFTALVAALEAKIPFLERHEVIVEMARIVAAVGDGHTNIYPTRDPSVGFHTLPVAFTFFGDELYVRAAHESQRSLAGARVLRIGDRDSREAYAAVKTMIGRDNEYGARYWAPYLLAMPEVLHALRITQTLDAVPLMLATSRGEERVVLHPFAPVEIMTGDVASLFNRRDGWIDVRDLSGRPDPLWLRRARRIPPRAHRQPALRPDQQGRRQGRRDARAFRSTPARRDRRHEAGKGRDRSPPQSRRRRHADRSGRARPHPVGAHRSQGRLFAIIGPATFSAAQMFADALEKYTNVTFVGEPTGSKGNAYGDSRKITLPNSRITVRASIYYWQEWHPMDKRDATIPQIPAPLTIDAYRNNVDPALDAIEHATAPESEP